MPDCSAGLSQAHRPGLLGLLLGDQLFCFAISSTVRNRLFLRSAFLLSDLIQDHDQLPRGIAARRRARRVTGDLQEEEELGSNQLIPSRQLRRSPRSSPASTGLAVDQCAFELDRRQPLSGSRSAPWPESPDRLRHRRPPSDPGTCRWSSPRSRPSMARKANRFFTTS